MNANQTRKSLDNTEKCLNPVFVLEQPKNYQDVRRFHVDHDKCCETQLLELVLLNSLGHPVSSLPIVIL